MDRNVVNHTVKILKILVENKVNKKDFETIVKIVRKEHENYGVIQEDTQKEFFEKF